MSHSVFKAKLLFLMAMRAVVAFAFLGAAIWFQLKPEGFAAPSLYPLYSIVAGVGVLTLVYALTLKRTERLRTFAYFQVALDAALVTAIVYVTGGAESYLSVLYPLFVVASAVLLDKKGGYWSAVLSSFAYGILATLDFRDALPERYMAIVYPSNPSWEDLTTTVATNILAFITVAYLVGRLAEKTAKIEKRLEEKEIDFERLETLNRLIVDNILSGIMTLDEKNRITSFNRAASAITGFSLREVYYRDVEDFFCGLMEAITGGERMEKTFRFKDGKTATIGFTASKGQGGDMTDIVIFQDLTKLAAMEEALKRDDKLKALGALSAALAHEIRNPLASISGSVQVLSQELELSGDRRHLMDIVQRESERLNSLITDFLLFAKPAREKTVTFDVAAAITETVEAFSMNPEAARVKVETKAAPSLFIEGDRRQIIQVFWNLLLNAGSAMPEGGAISIEAKEKDGSIAIEFSDTGVGIEPENISRIFDPFFSTKERGCGLGLSLAYRIVESHGGSIEVKSAPGRGATFMIKFPAAKDSTRRATSAL